MAHGAYEADKAYKAACQMFGARSVPTIHIALQRHSKKGRSLHSDDSVPTTEMPISTFNEGISAFKLFQTVGLAQSGGEARRLIDQGGGYVNGIRLESFDQIITSKDINEMTLLIASWEKEIS